MLVFPDLFPRHLRCGPRKILKRNINIFWLIKMIDGPLVSLTAKLRAEIARKSVKDWARSQVKRGMNSVAS